MTLVQSPEHTALREAVGDFLARHLPFAKVRDACSSERTHNDEWFRFGAELGVLGLAVPIDHGGSGASLAEQAVVLEALGGCLALPAYLSGEILAPALLMGSADPEAVKLLTRISAGDIRVTVGLTAETRDLDDSTSSNSWNVRATATVADEVGPGRYTVNGVKTLVPDVHGATAVLIPARTAAGLVVLAVDLAAPGVKQRSLTTLDITRPMARLEFDDAAAILVVGPETADAVIEHALDLARTAIAIEQVGGAQACLDMTVAYAKTRVQFGRPIGSFQAVKHACADMLVAVESARSAAYHAVAAYQSEEFPIAAAMAKVVAGEAFVDVAAQTIQLHGGIGFTWEHNAHLFYRRAHSTSLWFGDADSQRELLIQRLGF